MKKVFAIAALAFSMSLVSCGGDKGTGTDSDSTVKKDVPAVENKDNAPKTDVATDLKQEGAEVEGEDTEAPADLKEAVDAAQKEMNAAVSAAQQEMETAQKAAMQEMEAAQKAAMQELGL